MGALDLTWPGPIGPPENLKQFGYVCGVDSHTVRRELRVDGVSGVSHRDGCTKLGVAPENEFRARLAVRVFAWLHHCMFGLTPITGATNIEPVECENAQTDNCTHFRAVVQCRRGRIVDSGRVSPTGARDRDQSAPRASTSRCNSDVHRH